MEEHLIHELGTIAESLVIICLSTLRLFQGPYECRNIDDKPPSRLCRVRQAAISRDALTRDALTRDALTRDGSATDVSTCDSRTITQHGAQFSKAYKDTSGSVTSKQNRIHEWRDVNVLLAIDRSDDTTHLTDIANHAVDKLDMIDVETSIANIALRVIDKIDDPQRLRAIIDRTNERLINVQHSPSGINIGDVHNNTCHST